MKLANRAFIIALTMLTLVFAMSAQTLRSDKDDRNIAPTVGTGGSPGGPTGLFTVYDGQTLRRGEFTFSIAYSNYDRDPGNVDISEVPVSFQIGLNDYLELFFNTDAYRSIKVNSPRNLSGFYLPNSGPGLPAIVAGSGNFAGQAVFRPAGTQPFVNYPYVGGSGFPQFPVLGVPSGGGNGASVFPLVGSAYGSILPGIVLQSTTIANGQAPLVFTVAPSYLNDAPFLSRRYTESSFNTFTVGAKWRWTGPNNPVGVGVIPFYRFYADKADDFSGFNQLQRGSSPGSNRGDLGAIFFADARVRKWMNVSGNIGYIWNGDVKADDITLLDRGDELLAGVAIDFPVNKYFQPILEFKSQRFVGGRTPNAFENNPLDGIAGARIFPTRWMSIGLAYRYHFNQQDRDSFDDEDSFSGTTTVLCPTVAGGPTCTPFTVTNSFRGVPNGFLASNDPHGFIVQGTIGRRNKRQAEIINVPAKVDSVTVSKTTVSLPCAPGTQSQSNSCSDEMSVNVTTAASDVEGDQLVYNYTVSGGRIVGSGANVSWDLSGVRPGSYTITAGVDDGCGICGETKTQTVEVKECPDCIAPCECPTVSVTGPSAVVQPGETMTFTANLNGGSQDAPTYNWTVSTGTIVEGQGTPTITVSTEGLRDVTITATVDIGGLCTTCGQLSGSETGVVAGIVEPQLTDEFGPLANDDVRQRIDNFFVALQNDPSAQGYIINYGPARQVTARERLIRNHIAFRKFDASRIVIVNGGVTEEINTKLWLVPQGATPPTP
jgi:hypothetical protein